MDKSYHRSITTRALGGLLSPRALRAIIAANLNLDSLVGQLAHDEYHFDNNAFAASKAFIQAQRTEIRPALEAGRLSDAWQAFGRLTHTVQDYYAHTNYVHLWLEKNGDRSDQTPAEIDPLDPDLLSSPALRSGRLYYPLDALVFVPLVGRLVIPFLPHDSHAWMNMDAPHRPGYAYAEAAAVQRTRFEFTHATQGWTKALLEAFIDLHEV